MRNSRNTSNWKRLLDQPDRTGENPGKWKFKPDSAIYNLKPASK